MSGEDTGTPANRGCYRRRLSALCGPTTEGMDMAAIVQMTLATAAVPGRPA
jgi:hypothetical protein